MVGGNPDGWHRGQAGGEESGRAGACGGPGWAGWCWAGFVQRLAGWFKRKTARAAVVCSCGPLAAWKARGKLLEWACGVDAVASLLLGMQEANCLGGVGVRQACALPVKAQKGLETGRLL